MVLFDLFVCFLGFYLMLEFLNIFLKSKGKKEVSFMLMILSAIVLYSINHLNIGVLNTITTLLLLILLAFYAFDASKGAISALSVFAVMNIVFFEFASIYLLSFLLQKKAEDVVSNEFDLIICSVLPKLLFFLFSRVLNQYISYRGIKKYSGSIVLVFPVYGLFVLYSFLSFDEYLPLTRTYALWLASICIFTIITCIIVFYIYDQQQRNHNLKFELKTASDFQKQQEDVLNLNQIYIQEISAVRHDYVNHLLTLQALYEKDVKAGQNYLENLTGEFTLKFNAIKEYTNNQAINGILAVKKKICDNAGIDTEIRVSVCDLEFISHRDVCIIFGNALDNAIRACKSLIGTEKKPKITVSISQYRNIVCINFVNSRNSLDIIYLQENQFISTKQDKHIHGFGINNINQVVEIYGGSAYFECLDDYFEVSITLPYQAIESV